MRIFIHQANMVDNSKQKQSKSNQIEAITCSTDKN